MFSDSELMKNDVLRNAWRKGTDRKTRIEPGEDIAKICNEWRSRLEYDTIDRRQCLTASAILLSGTAGIYKDELEKLIEDCMQLDKSMIQSRWGDAYDTEDTDSIPDEEDEEDCMQLDKSMIQSRWGDAHDTEDTDSIPEEEDEEGSENDTAPKVPVPLPDEASNKPELRPLNGDS